MRNENKEGQYDERYLMKEFYIVRHSLSLLMREGEAIREGCPIILGIILLTSFLIKFL